MTKIQSINPYTKELNAEFDLISKEKLEEKIQDANKTFYHWKNTSFEERKKLFKKLSEILLENKEDLAKINVSEMGMTYKNALADVSKSASGILWFVENAEEILKDKNFEEGGIKGKIIHEPLGVLYSVAPWNFPFNQVFRNAVPNIISGNVVLNKHASNVPMVAQKIEELFLKSGFPKGVFTNLFISPKDSEYIISHELVRGTNITGGDFAGREIGRLAGQNLIPSLLELGGNDPFIVLENNDLDRIVNDAVSARLGNCGQKCNSAKRFIILDKYYDEFCEKFTEKMSLVKVGDPMEDDTVLGPLAKTKSIDDIEKQINDSIEYGAVLTTGGSAIDKNKNLFPATVLKEVTPGMKVFDEEVFGPVAPLIRAKDNEEAIKLANMSKFGLGCSLYGDNIEELEKLSSKIEAGNVFINKIVTSYPFLPYGGIKDSGYGKELGERGLKAFVNEKVVVL